MTAAAIGELSLDEIPRIVEVERRYEPSASNRVVYDQLFAEFLNIYKRNKGIYARLNRH